MWDRFMPPPPPSNKAREGLAPKCLRIKVAFCILWLHCFLLRCQRHVRSVAVARQCVDGAAECWKRAQTLTSIPHPSASYREYSFELMTNSIYWQCGAGGGGQSVSLAYGVYAVSALVIQFCMTFHEWKNGEGRAGLKWRLS